jgi:hypothetical protein
VKKRRLYWPHGNPQFDAWEISSPGGPLIARRNHALVTGKHGCQGWDLWIEQRYIGALAGRGLADLASLARAQLLQIVRPACCSRHRDWSQRWTTKAAGGWGGPRPNSGRPRRGDLPRVRLGTTIDPRTLEIIDRLRGAASRGEFLDQLIQAHAAP